MGNNVSHKNISWFAHTEKTVGNLVFVRILMALIHLNNLLLFRSDNLTALVMNATAETLIAAVGATLLDEEKAKPILETMLDLDVDATQAPKEILDSFEKVVVAHDGNVEADKISESLRFLDDLAAKCDLADSDVVKVTIA